MIAATVKPKIFGLFELDAAGTVMYSKVNALDSPVKLPANLVGLNLFEEVEPFENNTEFRRRFRYFANSSESAEKFSCVCHFEQTLVELNVMLTRISEREFDGRKKLIIVDIRLNNA